ncbi:MAG: glycosyltransferase family 2 protein [Bacteroidaceae bacterium]|nr:glycosyltransferase family 2 protein [Bacteroidaceae bacterium]
MDTHLTNTLVSVIMPTYNAAHWVAESIESVLNQTYKNLELIITDDCSTDNTRNILKGFEKKDPRVKVIYATENLGAGHTRNKCIEQAQGRFIAFCDSDDRWMPSKLEKQLAFMKEKDCCMVYASYITCDEQGRNTGVIIAPKRQSLFQTKCDDKIGFLTCIYDTEKTEGKMFMPVQRKRQDYAYVLQILQKCQYAYGIKEPLAYYRLHPESISANKLSLVKYEMLTWRVVFGDSKLQALLFFIFCFLPSYAWKKLHTIIINQHKDKYLNNITA